MIWAAYLAAAAKSASELKLNNENPIDGIPCIAPSIAAPIVPEYRMLMLEFEPWLMPEIMRSGLRSIMR